MVESKLIICAGVGLSQVWMVDWLRRDKHFHRSDDFFLFLFFTLIDQICLTMQKMKANSKELLWGPINQRQCLYIFIFVTTICWMVIQKQHSVEGLFLVSWQDIKWITSNTEKLFTVEFALILAFDLHYKIFIYCRNT